MVKQQIRNPPGFCRSHDVDHLSIFGATCSTGAKGVPTVGCSTSVPAPSEQAGPGPANPRVNEFTSRVAWGSQRPREDLNLQLRACQAVCSPQTACKDEGIAANCFNNGFCSATASMTVRESDLTNEADVNLLNLLVQAIRR